MMIRANPKFSALTPTQKAIIYVFFPFVLAFTYVIYAVDWFVDILDAAQDSVGPYAS